MTVELKDKVVSGFFWHSTERFGALALQSVVSILLARVLAPADFGMLSMLVVFSAVAQSVVDSGFTQALIRRPETTPRVTQSEYSSIFYLNIAVSVALYLVLVALAEPVARFYNQPDLVRYAPAVFAAIPVSALGLVQNAVIIKHMKFRTSAAINLTATIVTGVVALWMAYAGMGVWALVVQIVAREAVRVAMMWVWNRWMPSLTFSWSAVREMFGYGSRLMAAAIIGQVSANLAQLFIGKVYTSTQLGLYYQSQKLSGTFSITAVQAILNVTFPALARIQDNEAKMREASRKILIMTSFALFPLLMGLVGIAGDFFSVVLTPKWMGAVPYFRIFCLSGLFLPASYTVYNVLRVKGYSGLILRAENVKRIFMLGAILATVWISVMAVVWAMFAYGVVDMIVNLWYADRKARLNVTPLLRDSIPYLLVSAAMLAAILALGYLSAWIPALWLMCLKIVVGAGIYVALAAAFRTEAWAESRIILRQYIGKFRH